MYYFDNPGAGQENNDYITARGNRTTKIASHNTSKTNDTTNSNSNQKRRNGKLISIIAIIILLVLVASIYVANINKVTKPYLTTTQNISVNKSIQFAQVYGFASKFSPENLPSHLSANGVSVFNVSGCSEVVSTWRSVPELANSSAIINYSSLNQSRPFSIIITFSYVQPQELNNYISSIRTSPLPGVCGQTWREIANTAIVTSYNTTFYSGLHGYLDKLTNFTNTGLNLTATFYVGPRPNLTIYLTSVVYKNVRVGLSLWGFGSHLNPSAIINYTNYTLEQLINYTNK